MILHGFIYEIWSRSVVSQYSNQWLGGFPHFPAGMIGDMIWPLIDVVGLLITSGLDLMCGVNNVYYYATNMYKMGPQDS